jgi:hypothetical protein
MMAMIIRSRASTQHFSRVTCVETPTVEVPEEGWGWSKKKTRRSGGGGR